LADGKQLISASADQTLRLWDVGTRKAVRTFRGHKTEVWTAQLVSDQRTLVSGSKDGSVYRWDLQAERETSATWTIRRTVGALAFAGGGEFMVNVDAGGRVTRRQGRTFQEEIPLFELGPLHFAVFHPQRPLLAALTRDEKMQVWDWERRRLVREFPGLVGSQQALPQRFTQDGASIAVRLSSGPELFAYREWEIATGRETRSFDFPLTPGTGFNGTFSPDGTKFAHLAYPSGEGQLLDLQSGRATPLKLNVREPGFRPGFSADGGLLAVPSLQSSLRIYDVTANREVAALGGYMFGVHSAAFFPDGKRFVSGGSGVEAVALWDAQSHERLLTLAAKTTVLSTVEFSPDGNVLVGGGFGGSTQAPSTLHFWRAPSWAEIEQAEAKDPPTSDFGEPWKAEGKQP
jgi:WD40 repeat protein